MQTLLEMLKVKYDEYRSRNRPGPGIVVADDVYSFIRFAENYLDQNRIGTVNHSVSDNLVIKLRDNTEVLLSPLTSSQKVGGGVRNTEVVGVHTADPQAGGMDNVGSVQAH